MKKFIVSAIAAATLFVSTAVLASNPTVVLNNRTIEFEDQPAIISEEGRTLVPARGVFENMGAQVEWFESDRSISVVSKDSLTKVVLKIDDSVMKVRHFTDIMNYTEEQFTLETAPQIINDRTMIPLRAVSEAMDCNVEWNADAYTVVINTEKEEAPAEGETTAPVEDTRIKMSISADKEDVNAGDEIVITVNAENVKESNNLFLGATSRVFYDNTKFEYVGSDSSIYKTEKSVDSAENGSYKNNSVKYISILAESDIKLYNGAVCAFKFKALTDEGGEFKLSNSVSTELGSDTTIIVADEQDNIITYEDDNVLFIDITPVVVK